MRRKSMKKFVIMFFVVLGLAIGFQDVRAQNSQNADLHPPYLAEEEPAVPEGEEVPVLEEGEGDGVTERGLRRFNYKGKKVPLKKARPRITIPQKPKRKLRFPPIKRLPGDEGGQEEKKPLTEIPPTTIPPGNGWVPLPHDTPPPPQILPTPILPEIPGVPPPDTPSPPQCVWHTSDIIDPRIDVSAQERLMAMMSRGGEERLDASAMIGAVKQGVLAGILLAPRKIVSERGQRLTPPKGWWELIPQGQLGTCLQEPLGEPPMMLYRDKMGEANLDPSVIDHTLRTMWGQCGLPTPAPACSYLVDLHKPPPGSDSPDQPVEGYGELQVFVKGEGKALQGVKVSVQGILKEQPGHENYQIGNEPEKLLTLIQFTNGEGVAAFLIPPVQNRISVQVTGPPGFYNHRSEFGFLPKETKGISVELGAIPPSGFGS